MAPRAISEANAWIVTDMLRDVINRGTGQRARALGRNEREIRCRVLSDRRVAPMAECSDYRDRTAVSLHDMTDMAWRVRVLPTGKVEILHPDEIEPRKRYVRLPGFLARFDDD